MLRNYRVYQKSGSNLLDFSKELSDARLGTVTFNYAAGDFLYLGSELPFNHRYFQIGTANDQAATPTVELWTGAEWVAAVDLRDETAATSGVPLSQSGILSWAMDEQNAMWNFCDTVNMPNSGLETLRIYRLYWVRISFSASLKATTTLKYVGHKFCREEDINAEYPDLALTTLKTAWSSTKTDWLDQILVASEYITEALMKGCIIDTPDQILDWRLYEKACVHKTAEIVFDGLGQDYDETRVRCIGKYKSAMKAHLRIDQNRNIRVDQIEKGDKTGYLSR